MSFGSIIWYFLVLHLQGYRFFIGGVMPREKGGVSTFTSIGMIDSTMVVNSTNI